jgi:glycosyltransferase involved in cell wall biosynthesis
MPAVSVIMPAYEAAPYLRTAVDSVLRQTFADLELLIIDDGSSDHTLDVAYACAARDSRVRVLPQPHAGPGPARNFGFREAAGRLFAFLDSDDEWDDTFLAEHVAVLAARPDVDVVIGNAWNRGGKRDGQPSRLMRGEGLPITLAEILADETSLFIMAVFRREVVETIGGFDPAMFTNEEYEMWIRAALAGFAFTRHMRPLGWYSHRPDSLSASETRMLRGILRVLAKVRPVLPAASPELAILEHQVIRFRAELAAAERKERLRRFAAGRAILHVRQLVRRAVLGPGEGDVSAPVAREPRVRHHSVKKSLA